MTTIQIVSPDITEAGLSGLNAAQILDFLAYAVTAEDDAAIDAAVSFFYATEAGLIGPFTPEQIAEHKREAADAQAEHDAWMDGGGRDERAEDFEDREDFDTDDED